MYRRPEPDQRLGFGDVLEAEWLFDLYLRHDAVALEPRDKGGGVVYIPRAVPPRGEREPGKDVIASHAEFGDAALGFGNPRRAIILTDDCEMESLQGRGHGGRTRGRIVLAAVRRASADEIKEVRPGTFGLFALPPDEAEDFDGGIVELQRAFSVYLPSLLGDARPPRLVGLDAEAQGQLAVRWCAHATRHGPMVAQDGAHKLAGIMSAAGRVDVLAEIRERRREPEARHLTSAEYLAATLAQAWTIEGRVLDQVSDAWERGDPTDGSRAVVVEHLERLRALADSTIEALRDAASRNGGA